MINKSACLQRAEQLVLKNEQVSLRYACLELRLFIELVCYEKLKLFLPNLPNKMSNEWHPKKIMETLLEINPDLLDDQTIDIILEKSAIRLGKVTALTIPFLRKNYNKLGRFLHAPKVKESSFLPVDFNIYLITLINELKEHLNTINTSIFEHVEFTCQDCQSLIIRNSRFLTNGLRIRCLNDTCRAEYFISGSEGEWLLNLVIVPFECLQCKTPDQIAKHALEKKLKNIGDTAYFECSNCNEKHALIMGIQIFNKV